MILSLQHFVTKSERRRSQLQLTSKSVYTTAFSCPCGGQFVRRPSTSWSLNTEVSQRVNCRTQRHLMTTIQHTTFVFDWLITDIYAYGVLTYGKN